MEPAVGSSEGEVWRSGLLSECPAEVHAAVLEFSAHRPDRRRHLAVAAGSGQVRGRAPAVGLAVCRQQQLQ